MQRRARSLVFIIVAIGLAAMDLTACAGRSGGAGQAPVAGGQGTYPAGAVPPKDAGQVRPSEDADAVALPPPSALPLGSADEAFIARHVGRPVLLLYYDDSSDIDARLARLAINHANRYLQDREGLAVIGFDRIADGRKEPLATPPARAVPLRRLALAFGADLSVLIGFSLKTEMRGGSYFAFAVPSLRFYDAASGSLVAMVDFDGQGGLSPSSAEAASSTAVTNAVWLAMPKALAKARELLASLLRGGACYELSISGLADAKAAKALSLELAARFRQVVSLEETSGKAARYLLFAFVEADAAEAAIRDAANAAGLGLEPDRISGRAFAFRAGIPETGPKG